MALKVDRDCCTACGTCQTIAPETFGYDEEGKAFIKDANGNSEDAIQEAIDSCPNGCISK